MAAPVIVAAAPAASAAGAASATATTAATAAAAELAKYMLVQTATQIAVAVAVDQAGSALGTALVAGYGEKRELQADEEGAKYAWLAGFDQEAELTLLRQLDALNSETTKRVEMITSGFINCKPGLEKRIDRMEKVIAELEEDHPRVNVSDAEAATLAAADEEAETAADLEVASRDVETPTAAGTEPVAEDAETAVAAEAELAGGGESATPPVGAGPEESGETPKAESPAAPDETAPGAP